MTLASDITTAVSTATTAMNTLATQVALLESYRVAQGDGGGAFYAAGGHTASTLLDQWRSSVEPVLKSLIRG